MYSAFYNGLLISPCESVFKAQYWDGDYHKEMNDEVFKNIGTCCPTPSIPILCDSSYHN